MELKKEANTTQYMINLKSINSKKIIIKLEDLKDWEK